MSLEAWGDESPIDADYDTWADRATDEGWFNPEDYSPGAIAIMRERERQEVREGYKPKDDDAWDDGSILAAGIAYAISAFPAGYFNDDWDQIVTEMMENFWPWGETNWKPKSPRADLVRAGALIAAEIDRLDRLAAKSSTS